MRSIARREFYQAEISALSAETLSMLDMADTKIRVVSLQITSVAKRLCNMSFVRSVSRSSSSRD